MADMVCAITVRDITVRYRVVRYSSCGVCKTLRDISFRYRIVRCSKCGVCKKTVRDKAVT